MLLHAAIPIALQQRDERRHGTAVPQPAQQIDDLFAGFCIGIFHRI